MKAMVRIQPGVQRVEHGARHRDAKVRLHHGRRVGQHHRHRVALAHAGFLQGAGQLAAARVHLAPAAPQRAVHHGQPLGYTSAVRSMNDSGEIGAKLASLRGRSWSEDVRHVVSPWFPLAVCR
jgi:hypothetical protein